MQSDAPADGWWPMKRWFHWILRFALGLTLFGVVASQSLAPTAEPPLVAYFVTWHGTARGFKSDNVDSGTEMATRVVSHFGEATASAIVRFQEISPGSYLVYDARYVSLVVVDSQRRHDRGKFFFPGREKECDEDWSYDIADPSANSGLYVPPDPRRRSFAMGKLGNGPLVMRPDGWLWSWRWHRPQFTLHFRYSMSEPCSGTEDKVITDPDLTEEFVSSVFNFKYDDPNFEMHAVVPNDYSAFTFQTPYTAVLNSGHGQGETVTGEWSGEAHRLGKCPCAISSVNPLASGLAWAASPAAPPAYINYDDQGLVSGQAKEVVRVHLMDAEIDANSSMGTGGGIGGSTPLTGTGVIVFVETCDGIPVKGETVEITVDPIKNSGGHQHTDHRPGGKLNDKEIDKQPPPANPGTFDSCPQKCITVRTDEHGEAYDPSSNIGGGPIYYTPPSAGTDTGARYGAYEIGVAGVYQITARSKQFHDSKGDASVTVRVPSLQPLEPSGPNFDCCPHEEEAHKINNYATPGTIKAFKGLANEFQKAQDNHNAWLQSPSCQLQPWNNGQDYPVSFNDIALQYGGIFDRGKDWKVNQVEGHGTHNKGEGGDFNRFLGVPNVQTAKDCWIVQGFTSVGISKFDNRVRAWLLTTLLELGASYGHWDCTDLALGGSACKALNAGGPAPAITMNQAGTEGFPHRLHLHVED